MTSSFALQLVLSILWAHAGAVVREGDDEQVFEIRGRGAADAGGRIEFENEPGIAGLATGFGQWIQERRQAGEPSFSQSLVILPSRTPLPL